MSPSIDTTLSLPTLALLVYRSQFGRISPFPPTLACVCVLPVTLDLWINRKLQRLDSDISTQHSQDLARTSPEQ
ncbi:hypothetical protein BLNAU_3995 [Blattamonas nauphoetae]|uniref:Uncharacterized protein n=1 Tax=Blattamonas nauphoetae TaxID=2049346 RepID=A0ABQ9YB48_9EUKA|nr:hypothetical protein BLNAU_3995 [Blattamonas nauphoetae]